MDEEEYKYMQETLLRTIKLSNREHQRSITLTKQLREANAVIRQAGGFIFASQPLMSRDEVGKTLFDYTNKYNISIS